MPNRTDVISTFDAWLAWVFDHPVERKPWYWHAEHWPNGNDRWPFEPKTGQLGNDAPIVLEYLTKLFEDPNVLIGRFSTGQIAQGLDLVGGCSWPIICVLFESTLPIGDRRACIRSMESLSKQLFATVCDRALSHVRSSSNPLNGAC